MHGFEILSKIYEDFVVENFIVHHL